MAESTTKKTSAKKPAARKRTATKAKTDAPKAKTETRAVKLWRGRTKAERRHQMSHFP
jgi:hypothetical protein